MSITIYVLRRTGLVRDWRRTADPGSSRHNATPRKPVTSPVAVISCTFAPQHAADRTKVMITGGSIIDTLYLARYCNTFQTRLIKHDPESRNINTEEYGIEKR